jgi:hypothetical protein
MRRWQIGVEAVIELERVHGGIEILRHKII